MKYAFMLNHKSEFYLSTMCRVLNVSRSSFYYWLNGCNNRHLRQQAQQSLDQQVAFAFQAEKSRSGAIRLVRRLSKMGLHYNRKTVAASLKRQGLRAKAARKFKATTQSNYTEQPSLTGCRELVATELPFQSAESKMGGRHHISMD